MSSIENGDGAGAGAWKWNGAPPCAGSNAPSSNTICGTYTAGKPGVPLCSHSTMRRWSASQNSVYQLHSGGTSPLAEPTTGAPDEQPLPSGDSTTTPKLAIVAGLVRPLSVTFSQCSARANSSGRPVEESRTGV